MDIYTHQQTVALEKMRKYCAYQDRCHQDVRTKLLALKVYGEDLEIIMTSLITDNFLNEERFAKSFVRGKFRMKQWGRIKIKQALKAKNISDYCLRKGLEEIEEIDYLATLNILIQKKTPLIKAESPFELRKKLAAYLIRRGFETQLVWEQIRTIIQD